MSMFKILLLHKMYGKSVIFFFPSTEYTHRGLFKIPYFLSLWHFSPLVCSSRPFWVFFCSPLCLNVFPTFPSIYFFIDWKYFYIISAMLIPRPIPSHSPFHAPKDCNYCGLYPTDILLPNSNIGTPMTALNFTEL